MMISQRFTCDEETGEALTYAVNKETGEPLIKQSLADGCVTSAKQKIRVSIGNRNIRFRKGYSTNSKKFQTLKANIIAGSNPVSHRLLLIPIVMFCSEIMCTFFVFFEIYLHVRCHKKNKAMKSSNLYYRSPFHVVTSIFCGACRESESACKVGLLQDKRRNRYDYIKGISM